MRYRYFARLYLFVFIMFYAIPSLAIKSQIASLPQDIMFFEIDYSQKEIQYRLSWLNATTRSITTFYHDPEFAYWPVAWSPTGRYLAAVKIIDSLSGQLCLFTREGKLHVCVNKTIDSDSYSGSENRMKFKVQWSQDESSIFYINTGGIYQFNEANTQTGEITRVLYSGPVSNWRGEFSWNRERDVIIEDVRNINLSTTGATTNFVQLNPITAQKSAIVPFKYVIPTNPIQDSTTDVATHLLTPCPFSPKGTYVAAYDTIAEDPLLFALLDKHANIVQMIPKSAQIPLPVNCPAWVLDESAFYYQKLDSHIYKYFIAEKRYESFYEGEGKYFFGADFGVSEDQNYLLNISQEYVELSEPIPKNARSYVYKLVVIGPHNNIEFLGNKYSDSVLPLWVPPLKN